MPVFNHGEFFASLFTWLKLGVSLACLVLLITKLIDVWEDTQTSSEFQNRTEDAVRY